MSLNTYRDWMQLAQEDYEWAGQLLQDNCQKSAKTLKIICYTCYLCAEKILHALNLKAYPEQPVLYTGDLSAMLRTNLHLNRSDESYKDIFEAADLLSPYATVTWYDPKFSASLSVAQYAFDCAKKIYDFAQAEIKKREIEG